MVNLNEHEIVIRDLLKTCDTQFEGREENIPHSDSCSFYNLLSEIFKSRHFEDTVKLL